MLPGKDYLLSLLDSALGMYVCLYLNLSISGVTLNIQYSMYWVSYKVISAPLHFWRFTLWSGMWSLCSLCCWEGELCLFFRIEYSVNTCIDHLIYAVLWLWMYLLTFSLDDLLQDENVVLKSSTILFYQHLSNILFPILLKKTELRPSKHMGAHVL